MTIDSTITFQKNFEALFNDDKRYIVNQGSSRSGKTWGLCQLLILYALKKPDTKITILRKSFNALKKTAMADMLKVMRSMNVYNMKNHNKTDNHYTYPNGSMMMFISADDEQKLRGLSSDIVWCNEGNELYYDDYLQLDLRCTDRFIIDYNPSDADSWIYNLPDEEKIIIKSTYKDNPFLAKRQVKLIESLKDSDPDSYQIYGLGERATSRKNVYQNWHFVDSKPPKFQDYVYGLDFGYNHPTALIRVYYCDNEIYCETVIYESYLTTESLIDKMKELNIETHIEIMCDYSRPEIIQELRINDFNTFNANKTVKKGIDNVKSFSIYVHEHDKYIKKEYENYMWKKVHDRILDEPVKLYDDAMDAIRYAVFQIKDFYFNAAPFTSWS